MHKKIRTGINWLRSMVYGLKYPVGKKCTFESIKLWNSPKDTVKFGNHVRVMRRTEFRALKDKPIIIGDNTLINFDCILRPNVTIGNNVAIGTGVHFISDSHEIGSSEQRAGKGVFNPRVVENGCWIGSDVTILGNVRIGKGTIIGAGSLVNKNCEPNSLYAGVPAKLIKKLS